MLNEFEKNTLKFIASILGLITFFAMLLTLTIAAVYCKDSHAQSTQEINRQQHQAEVDRQQRQILQQQYIQTQQLEQMRRDAEFRFNSNQSNRTHDQSHIQQPRY